MEELFDPFDFNYEFETEYYDSDDRPEKVVQEGVPINAYKQFKAIDRYGNTYYMSGVKNGY